MFPDNVQCNMVFSLTAKKPSPSWLQSLPCGCGASSCWSLVKDSVLWTVEYPRGGHWHLWPLMAAPSSTSAELCNNSLSKVQPFVIHNFQTEPICSEQVGWFSSLVYLQVFADLCFQINASTNRGSSPCSSVPNLLCRSVIEFFISISTVFFLLFDWQTSDIVHCFMVPAIKNLLVCVFLSPFCFHLR